MSMSAGTLLPQIPFGRQLVVITFAMLCLAGHADARVRPWNPARLQTLADSGMAHVTGSDSTSTTVTDSLVAPGLSEPPPLPAPPRRLAKNTRAPTSNCSCMFAIGVSGVPEEFTHDIRSAMASSGFGDTSPGGCIYFPFFYCFEPTYYPKDGEGNSNATVFTASYTFPSGLHLGAVYEGRQMGGVLGWNTQAGQLNLSAKGRNLAAVVGFEKPFSRGDDFGNRLHGRVAIGPAISTVRVVASGTGANTGTSTTRVGVLLEAGISCRTRSVFVLDLALQRWQLGKYDVGPYTVTSSSGSQVFAPVSVERSHTGVYFSVGIRP